MNDFDEGGNVAVDRPQVENPFAVGRPLATNAAATTNESTGIAEVQAKLIIAKRFPRDQIAAVDKIVMAFTRPGLAEKAEYQYARGGSDISGPSIRAAETIAQLWGNMDFGLRELSQDGGYSTVEAFAWDMETNTRRSMTFQVRHWRDTKKGGYKLEDGRDIYELVANMGQRRVRACILGVLPGDVVETAMKQSALTLKSKAEVTPERLKGLLEKFAEFKVSQAMIEKRIQRRLDAMTPALLVGLGKIYNSLRDAMSEPGEWFELEPGTDATPAGTEQPTRGAAGLKAGAAKAAAATVTKPTKEPSPTYTLAQVQDAMNKAIDVEVLNDAATLIPMIESVVHKEEAQKHYVARKAELSKE